MNAGKAAQSHRAPFSNEAAALSYAVLFCLCCGMDRTAISTGPDTRQRDAAGLAIAGRAMAPVDSCMAGRQPVGAAAPAHAISAQEGNRLNFGELPRPSPMIAAAARRRAACHENRDSADLRELPARGVAHPRRLLQAGEAAGGGADRSATDRLDTLAVGVQPEPPLGAVLAIAPPSPGPEGRQLVTIANGGSRHATGASAAADAGMMRDPCDVPAPACAEFGLVIP